MQVDKPCVSMHSPPRHGIVASLPGKDEAAELQGIGWDACRLDE